jgi:6-phosphogluconate dehydrogenase
LYFLPLHDAVPSSGLRSRRLPAALIQGQRDCFGAHTYKRVDREGTFHTDWSGDRNEIEL